MKTKITQEIVASVKKYANKYPDMLQEDIAKLVGISHGSVCNILNGKYDEEEKKIESQIPYETYRRLVLCEEACMEILRNMKSDFEDEDRTFVDYRVVSAIIKRFLPEEYESRLNEIKGTDSF